MKIHTLKWLKRWTARPWFWKALLRWTARGRPDQQLAVERLIAAYDAGDLHCVDDEPLKIDLNALTSDSKPRTIVFPFGVAYVDYVGARFVAADGSERYMTRDGELTMKLPAATRVQIDDLDSLLDHTSVRVHHTVSHTLTFVRNGVLSYLVDDDRTMMEVHVKNLRLSTEEAGVLKVRPSDRSQ